MHCSLRLAPTMINHLTSLALFTDMVEQREEVLGLHVPYEVTYPHTLGPRGVLITERFGQVKQYYLYTKQNTFHLLYKTEYFPFTIQNNTFHLLYKTEYFPFTIQNRTLSICYTKQNTFHLLYKTQYFPFAIQNRILSIYYTKQYFPFTIRNRILSIYYTK